MAQQINSKLSSTATPMETSLTNGHAPLVGTSHQHSNESVDLDNLFAFLSEVTPSNSNTNTIIDDIGEKMDNLVQDLDVELENVIQQEIEGLAMEKPKAPTTNSKTATTGVPSLPEPTMPPPPPPIENGLPPIPAPPPKPVPMSKRHIDEPIYEAVIPRDELPTVPEMPDGLPPPPPPAHHLENGHKLRFVHGTLIAIFVRLLMRVVVSYMIVRTGLRVQPFKRFVRPVPYSVQRPVPR